jgi:glutathione S-transferase
MLKLYYSPGACSLAPHILLEELGAKYEMEHVSVDEGKTQSPEYLAINPKGRVPALLNDDDELLTELPAICWYLAHETTSTLFPKNAMLGARCLEWLNWLSGTLHAVAIGQLTRPMRYVHDKALYPKVAEKGMENALANFQFIETQLGGHKWAVNDSYTVVDPCLLVFYRWGNQMRRNMRAHYPKWTQLAERVLDRAAVQRAMEQEGITTATVRGRDRTFK